MKRKETKHNRDHYIERKDITPDHQPEYIDSRNNNQDVANSPAREPNVRSDNQNGIGSASVNNDKLSNYTENHSADA